MLLTELLKLDEAGQDAGNIELVNTSVEEARKYAEELMKENGRDLDTEIPDFDSNYVIAQKKAGMGRTVRKDMPVIDAPDVKKFQDRLAHGTIDLHHPFGDDDLEEDPFPAGLSGDDATDWLHSGLKKNDGDEHDDKVPVETGKVRVGDLKPIQKQIYFDKSIAGAAENGAADSVKFFTTKTFFIVSTDNFIIDGHHRFLGAVLIDPDMEVQVLRIDLPIKELLPLSLAYGDAIGNKRNA